MDLNPMVIDPDDAKVRLDEYVALRADERTAEDEAIAAGYRAAARGLPVISLPDTIQRGGYFENGLPRIAVCRADATHCWVQRRAWGTDPRNVELTYYDQPNIAPHRKAIGRHRIVIEVPPPAVTVNEVNGWRTHSTVVPIVPPRHRPRARRLWRYHVLWEVEKWDPTPPVDPALLRHIRGDLFAVVATWDLTELERAVLAARAE